MFETSVRNIRSFIFPLFRSVWCLPGERLEKKVTLLFEMSGIRRDRFRELAWSVRFWVGGGDMREKGLGLRGDEGDQKGGKVNGQRTQE